MEYAVRFDRAERNRKRLMARFGEASPEKTAFTMDVSETGAFLKTNMVVPPGRVIRIELKFPDRTFSFRARVVWAKRVPPQLAHLMKCGMGVSFLDAGDDWYAFYADWTGQR